MLFFSRFDTVHLTLFLATNHHHHHHHHHHQQQQQQQRQQENNNEILNINFLLNFTVIENLLKLRG